MSFLELKLREPSLIDGREAVVATVAIPSAQIEMTKDQFVGSIIDTPEQMSAALKELLLTAPFEYYAVRTNVFAQDRSELLELSFIRHDDYSDVQNQTPPPELLQKDQPIVQYNDAYFPTRLSDTTNYANLTTFVRTASAEEIQTFFSTIAAAIMQMSQQNIPVKIEIASMASWLSFSLDTNVTTNVVTFAHYFSQTNQPTRGILFMITDLAKMMSGRAIVNLFTEDEGLCGMIRNIIGTVPYDNLVVEFRSPGPSFWTFTIYADAAPVALTETIFELSDCGCMGLKDFAQNGDPQRFFQALTAYAHRVAGLADGAEMWAKFSFQQGRAITLSVSDSAENVLTQSIFAPEDALATVVAGVQPDESILQAYAMFGGEEEAGAKIFDVTTFSANHRKFAEFFPSDISPEQLARLHITDVSVYSTTPYAESVQIDETLAEILSEMDLKPSDLVATDATGNIGGDTVGLWRMGFHQVNSFEIDSTTCDILKDNLAVLGLPSNHVMCQDYLSQMDQLQQDVVFIDAPWGGPDYREQTDLDITLSNVSVKTIARRLLGQGLTQVLMMKLPLNYHDDNLITEFSPKYSHRRLVIERKSFNRDTNVVEKHPVYKVEYYYRTNPALLVQPQVSLPVQLNLGVPTVAVPATQPVSTAPVFDFSQLLPKPVSPAAQPVSPTPTFDFTQLAPKPVSPAAQPVSPAVQPAFDFTQLTPKPVSPAVQPVSPTPAFDFSQLTPKPVSPAAQPAAPPVSAAFPTFDFSQLAPKPVSPTTQPVSPAVQPTFDFTQYVPKSMMSVTTPQPVSPPVQPAPAFPTFAQPSVPVPINLFPSSSSEVTVAPPQTITVVPATQFTLLAETPAPPVTPENVAAWKIGSQKVNLKSGFSAINHDIKDTSGRQVTWGEVITAITTGLFTPTFVKYVGEAFPAKNNFDNSLIEFNAVSSDKKEPFKFVLIRNESIPRTHDEAAYRRLSSITNRTVALASETVTLDPDSVGVIAHPVPGGDNYGYGSVTALMRGSGSFVYTYLAEVFSELNKFLLTHPVAWLAAHDLIAWAIFAITAKPEHYIYFEYTRSPVEEKAGARPTFAKPAPVQHFVTVRPTTPSNVSQFPDTSNLINQINPIGEIYVEESTMPIVNPILGIPQHTDLVPARSGLNFQQVSLPMSVQPQGPSAKTMAPKPVVNMFATPVAAAPVSFYGVPASYSQTPQVHVDFDRIPPAGARTTQKTLYYTGNALKIITKKVAEIIGKRPREIMGNDKKTIAQNLRTIYKDYLPNIMIDASLR